MLFLAKQNARLAVLVMLGLIIVSNAWATLRGIDLGQTLSVNLVALLAGGLGLVFSASIDSTIYLLNWAVGFHPFLNAFDASFGKLFARVSLPAIFTGGLLAALGEETFFRGILQREWGLLPVALLFALAHYVPGANLLVAWALLEGLLFGWLYQLTGNLLVPMIVHGLHDSAGIFFGRYIYRRFFPPAETLFDWLHLLNAPAGKPASPARAIVPATPQE
jgi:uncharacterized protein